MNTTVNVNEEKFKFMKAYVLNRCLGGTNGSWPLKWTEDAEAAWNDLNKRCNRSE